MRSSAPKARSVRFRTIEWMNECRNVFRSPQRSQIHILSLHSLIALTHTHEPFIGNVPCTTDRHLAYFDHCLIDFWVDFRTFFLQNKNLHTHFSKYEWTRRAVFIQVQRDENKYQLFWSNRRVQGVRYASLIFPYRPIFLSVRANFVLLSHRIHSSISIHIVIYVQNFFGLFCVCWRL